MKLYKIPVHKDGYITIKADSEEQITQALYSMSTEEYESLVHWEDHLHQVIDGGREIQAEDDSIECDLDARKQILINIARKNIAFEWSYFQENYISPMRSMTDEQKKELLTLIFKREIRAVLGDTDKYQGPKINEILHYCDYSSKYYGIKPVPRAEFIKGTLYNLLSYARELGVSESIFTSDKQILATYPAPLVTSLGTLIKMTGYNLSERNESEILPEERPVYEKLTISDRFDFRQGRIDMQDALKKIDEYSEADRQSAAETIANYTADYTKYPTPEELWASAPEIKHEEKEKKNPFKSFFGRDKKKQ